MKKNMHFFVVILITVLFSFSVYGADPIKIGMIFDLTGKTKDVCVPFSEGFKDYFDNLNNQGGINGTKVELTMLDDKYDPNEAFKHYETLRSKGVQLIHGWGTASSLKLIPFVNKDNIVFFSGSYDDQLSDATKSPFNFFVGASYSTQAKNALEFIKEDYKGKDRPTVALLRNSTPFGKSPFNDQFFAKAKELNIKVIEMTIELNAETADEQIKRLIETNTTYGIIQETAFAAKAIVRSASNLHYTGKLIGLNWAFEEDLIQSLKELSEGYLGMPLFVQWEEKCDGLAEITKYLKARTGKLEKKHSKYIAGWATAQVIGEGLKKTKDIKSSQSIKEALETIKDYPVSGLSTPVSFSKIEHRGQKGCKIYEIKNGKILPVSDKIYGSLF